ncbi:cupin domain-containing protein [Actinoplanes sp. NPDC051411]|uniref:cupin domain-containing protein n=1 Tax=Actinoplanes sp. NPDC051411 TaxID=3155522 RepID=UPI003444BB85
MNGASLDALVAENVAVARAAEAGRSSHLLFHRRFRQVLLAFVAGRGLPAHDNPGSATLQVLCGRVRLTAAGESWEGIAGDLVEIPGQRHDLVAVEDSAILLTVIPFTQ